MAGLSHATGEIAHEDTNRYFQVFTYPNKVDPASITHAHHLSSIDLMHAWDVGPYIEHQSTKPIAFPKLLVLMGTANQSLSVHI